MDEAGLEMPEGHFVHSLEEGVARQHELGYPTIVRPSFTLGGSGGGIAYNGEEFERIVSHGLDLSPIGEVLIEMSVLGWKEYELEVMRDLNDNVVIICSIENFDPMGVHTGDSITVAPAQTLDRQTVPGDAGRCYPGDPAHRCRHGGIEHSVRSGTGYRAHGCNRDEPPGFAQLSPRLQGHRLSYREDRRQAGGGLHPRRDHKRHNPGDAGLFRTHD